MEVRGQFSAFDDYIWTLLFNPTFSRGGLNLLSHYKALHTLRLEVTIVQVEDSYETDEIVEKSKDDTLSNSPEFVHDSTPNFQFILPPILPSLKHFIICVEGDVHPPDSRDRFLQSRYPIVEFEAEEHVAETAKVAPNAQDLEVYLVDERLEDITMNILDQVFQLFRDIWRKYAGDGVPNIKRVRIAWPRTPIRTGQRVVEIPGTGIERKMVDWGNVLPKLETIVFVREPASRKFALAIEIFEAITGILRRDEQRGEVVDWTEVYIQEPLDMEV
ncbi:uncharacterized protein DFL_007904 [Arthrobotrys flagrans]|uniref:Uncharacterized protein n=1 Tax=Arthrobotrys flagrans TaxID=97331 RepID=A0A436ZX09_ARTFL|nr:hypothetical protein DFL_007904 [Arthrobotrys flagrans]